jgi:HEAT repeat protein
MASLGRQDLQIALTVLRERLLNDPEPDVQAAAADSLGGLQLTEAFEDLQHLYQTTPEWLVKFSIVAALGELGDRRSFELLENALSAGEELIRMAAISSFGELGDLRAVPLLVPHAAHADWQIRYRLAQALARLGGQEARLTLERLAQDEVQQVADAAKTGLQSA